MRQSPANRSPSSSQVLPPIYIGQLPSSPIGPLWVAVSGLGLVAVEWSMPQADFSKLVGKRFPTDVVYDEAHTDEARRQLSEYLDGIRRQFTLPLDLSEMSTFQVQVLRLTAQIPFGQSSTYQQIAIQAGNPHAARAVGRVEATNPIPLVIPCHRVLGSDGSLHGYGGPGGIKLKAWLLKLEGVLVK
jgi:methylated-DNA-[protein]-cysteine S-methyltransferase